MSPENMGVLQFVLSEENRRGATVTPVGRPSKSIPVQVIYDQPFLTSELDTNLSGCVATDSACDLTKTYTLDTTQNIGKTLKVSPHDLVGTAEENSAFVARQVAKLIDLVEQGLAENLAAAIAAQYGRWSVDTASIRGVGVTANILQVNDYEGATAATNKKLFRQVRQAIQRSRLVSPIVAGGGMEGYAMDAMTGGESADGINLLAQAQRYGFAPVYDRFLSDALASVSATDAVIGLGSIVPLGFSIFENDFNKVEAADQIATTIYSPRTGAKMDYIMSRPCADEDWNIIVRATYDFVTLPNDLYKTGSNFEGVKNLALLNVTCDDQAPCVS